MSTVATHRLFSRLNEHHQLVLQFFEIDGQFGHEIVLDNRGRQNTLLRTVDLGSTPPINPPLQQLITETRDTAVVVLGVGQSGRNHWSAAFEARPDSAIIDVHMACRLNEPIDWLGSTYQPGELASDCPGPRQPDQKTLIWLSGDVRLKIFGGLDSAVNVNDPQQQFSVIPALPTADEPPATIQWRYAFQMS